MAQLTWSAAFRASNLGYDRLAHIGSTGGGLSENSPQQEPREENAAYIATWLEVLKNDNRAIFAAAAHAQRAVDSLNQKIAAQVSETCAA